MENEIFVNTGEVEVCQRDGVLIASAIGSCVVVTVYEPYLRIGGMAHVMLPWTSRDPNLSDGTKYAEDAMKLLMRKITDYKASLDLLKICLIGGANLLGKGHDDIGAEISQSLLEILSRIGVNPVAIELGGVERRTCALYVTSGLITYTVGDSAQRTLVESDKAQTQALNAAIHPLNLRKR